MSIIALPAHFDGKRICLDEPFDLRKDTKLIVTVLPTSETQETDNEHEDWLFLSDQRLENAYGENEPEYSLDLIKEVLVTSQGFGNVQKKIRS